MKRKFQPRPEREILRLGCIHKFLCAARWLLAVIFLVAPFSGAYAQRAKPTEYQVKAVYLYNFSRFVEWPVRQDKIGDVFSICVLGQDPFGSALNSTLGDDTITGKKVVVKKISAPENAVGCRVLFISSSEEKKLKQILTVLDGASILTVSDMPEFTDRGGMMQFIWEGDRVRFEVNLSPAEHAGLTLSSELLKVAVNVKGASSLRD